MLLRRLFGVVLMLAGVVLALPGVPGPGLLIVLIGATLAGFPTSRWIEPHLAGHPRLQRFWRRLVPPPQLTPPPAPTPPSDPDTPEAHVSGGSLPVPLDQPSVSSLPLAARPRAVDS